jgi:hypothetical protein
MLIPWKRDHSLVVKWAPCKRLLSVRFRLVPLIFNMLHKLRQQINRHKFTQSNRLPLRRARQFLMNRFRSVRVDLPSAPLRAAMGLVR